MESASVARRPVAAIGRFAAWPFVKLGRFLTTKWGRFIATPFVAMTVAAIPEAIAGRIASAAVTLVVGWLFALV